MSNEQSNATTTTSGKALTVSTGSMDWGKLSDELQKKSAQYWERGESNTHSRQYDFVAAMVLTGLSDAIKNSIQSNTEIGQSDEQPTK